MINWDKSTYYSLLLFLIIGVFSEGKVKAQVKIGDNHETINAGSLLELESKNKGLMFPRVALDDDLTIWKLIGNDPMDGMVVFNTNSNVNEKGLYCWYNNKWNHFSGGGTISEIDTLSFNTDTRVLYDDGDTVQIPSGKVSLIDSISILQEYLDQGVTQEGDIFYVAGDGLYIKNNIVNATTVYDAFIFVPAMPKPGRILYANYDAIQAVQQHDSVNFEVAVQDSFYQEPDNPQILNVEKPTKSGNNGYYAFAVPNEWANPRIFLRVKNSRDGGFYKLNNCWTVTRELEIDGLLYQVWTLDVPLRESVMYIQGNKAQFMIE